MHTLKITKANNINCKLVPPKVKRENNLGTSINDMMENLSQLANKKLNQIHRARFVKLKDDKQNIINAIVINNKKSKSIYLKHGEKDLGGLLFSISNAPIVGDNYPEYYKGKKYLFINSIYSNKQYKGIGTELIKQAVYESKTRGCEGRICLNASTTKPSRGTPIPFYYKNGFESANKEKNNIIKESIKNGRKIPKECEAVTLFLPQDIINKILNE